MEIVPDYYARLGLPPKAEEAEIKSKYRALVRKYHPDTNPAPSAQEAFRAIQEAYDLLSDPAARARYHRECALCGKTWALDPAAVVDPAALAYEFSLLSRRLGVMGPQHISNADFQAYVLAKLNAETCALITAYPDQESRFDLVEVLFQATERLGYEDWLPLEPTLIQLAEGQLEWVDRLKIRTRIRRQQHAWQQRLPYLIIAISLLLCMAMFFWATAWRTGTPTPL